MENEEKPDWIQELEYRQHGILPRTEAGDRLSAKLRHEDEYYRELYTRDTAAAKGGFLIAAGLCSAAVGIWLGWFAFMHPKQWLWLPTSGALIFIGWKAIKRGFRY